MTAAETPEAVASIYVVDLVATAAFGTPLRTCGGGLREGVLLEAIRGSGPSQVAGAAD